MKIFNAITYAIIISCNFAPNTEARPLDISLGQYPVFSEQKKIPANVERINMAKFFGLNYFKKIKNSISTLDLAGRRGIRGEGEIQDKKVAKLINSENIDSITRDEITPVLIGRLKGASLAIYKQNFRKIHAEIGSLYFGRNISLKHLYAIGGEQFTCDMHDASPDQRMKVVSLLIGNKLVDFLELDTLKYAAEY